MNDAITCVHNSTNPWTSVHNMIKLRIRRVFKPIIILACVINIEALTIWDSADEAAAVKAYEDAVSLSYINSLIVNRAEGIFVRILCIRIESKKNEK